MRRATVVCGVAVLALVPASCRSQDEYGPYVPDATKREAPLGTTRPEETPRSGFGVRADSATAAQLLRQLRSKTFRGREPSGPDDYPVMERYGAFGRWTVDGFQIAQVERGDFAVTGRVLRDEEDWRLTALGGALSGYVYEHYLGRGFAFRLTVGFDRTKRRPLLAPAVDWWVTEELRYTFGRDPTTGWGVSFWQFDDDR